MHLQFITKADLNTPYMKTNKTNLKNHNYYVFCHTAFVFFENMDKGQEFQINVLHVSSSATHAFFHANAYIKMLKTIYCHFLFLHFKHNNTSSLGFILLGFYYYCLQKPFPCSFDTVFSDER